MGSCLAWVLVGDHPKPGREHDSDGCLVLSPGAHWKDTVSLVVMCDHSASREWGLHRFQSENATEMHFIS